MRYEGQQEAEIHRQAAELEWEVPPVVVPVIFYIIKKQLLVHLRDRQKNTAGEEQVEVEGLRAGPQLPRGKGGKRDAE